MKATIVTPLQAALLPEVPLESPLVLDLGDAGGGDGSIEKLVTEAEQFGHHVDRLLAAVPDLKDRALDALAAQPLRARVRVGAVPSVRVALERAKALANKHLTIELPVETDQDLSVLKILSSLGVATAVDARRLFKGGEVMLELLTDAVLRPGKRTNVSPIDELRNGFDDDDFELGRVDVRANDHHVDLRGGKLPPPEAWAPVDVWRKRERFLAERHPCAFCEGLLFCHGELLQDCGEACRAVFAEFTELQALRDRQDTAKATRVAKRKEDCGC